MRTVKDFVKQMFKLGRSPEHIRAVAEGSHWRNQTDEVDKWIRIGKRIARKKKNREVSKSSPKRTKSKRLKIRRKSS